MRPHNVADTLASQTRSELINAQHAHSSDRPPTTHNESSRTLHTRSHPVEQTLTSDKIVPRRAPHRKRTTESHRNEYARRSKPRGPETSDDEDARTSNLRERSLTTGTIEWTPEATTANTIEGEKPAHPKTGIKCDQTYTKWVMPTWEPVLSFNAELPNIWLNNWLTNSEVLVGRRMLRPLPEGGRGP